jgi:hypothetical protein
MDNFFKTCPPVMDDARLFTDYRPSATREQYLKNINGIVNEDNYRIFLQKNADHIMDKEWQFTKQTKSCFNNKCIHVYPTRSTPNLNNEELRVYNAVRTGKPVLKNVECSKLNDYRLTHTEGSTY